MFWFANPFARLSHRLQRLAARRARRQVRRFMWGVRRWGRR